MSIKDAEEAGVAAFNEAVEREGWEEEFDDSGDPIDHDARDMNAVAWSFYAGGKVDAMEAWAEELGLEIRQRNTSDTSAYVQIALPIEGEMDDYDGTVVVRLSDHGNRSRMPGGTLETEVNIAPGDGFSWLGGIALAMNAIYYSALGRVEEEEIEEGDPDQELASQIITEFKERVATPYGKKARGAGIKWVPKLPA
jgi:hypothetical protein